MFIFPSVKPFKLFTLFAPVNNLKLFKIFKTLKIYTKYHPLIEALLNHAVKFNSKTVDKNDRRSYKKNMVDDLINNFDIVDIRTETSMFLKN